MEEREEMTREREAAILEGALRTWGTQMQMVVAIEELSELAKAITKYLRYCETKQGSYDEIVANVREEMADVGVMLNQMALVFGDPVEEEIAKLVRLERRVAAGGKRV